MSQSTGVKLEEKRNKSTILPLVYNEAEIKAKSFYEKRIAKARDSRESPSEFLDGRGYSPDYVANRQASNSYLKPKMNDDEVRVVTGTTEKKIEVVQNEILAMNYQPEIKSYDLEDNEIVELGEDTGDIVKRTNEIEKDQDLWEEAVKEFLIQRGVFIEEYLDERTIKRNSIDITTKTLRKRIVSGLKVFLGDITIPLYLMDDQPYIGIYDKMSYDEAKSIWGDNERWQYVVAGDKNADGFDESFDFRLYACEKDSVEILTYLSSPDNEKQVIINGVMMYPLGTKLDNEHYGYNIKGFGLKSMSLDYAYCKGLASSAKVLQALNDETIRLLIRKFRQAVEPPTGVRKNYSKNIFNPAAQTVGIRKGDVEKLIDHDGVTNSEFAMWGKIDEKIEEFISSGSLQQGLAPDKSVTATEIQARQRQAAKMLGLAVLGFIRMKRELTYLRIYNIYENYNDIVGKKLNPLTQKIEDVYRKFTSLDSNLGGGKIGKKIISFSDKPLTDNDKLDIKEFEDRQSKMGIHTRFKQINLKRLAEIPIMWFVTIVEKSREGTPLDKAMFTEKIQQSLAVSQITGIPLAGEQIVEDFGRTWKAKDWFSDKGVEPQQQQEGEGEGDEKVKTGANQLMSQIEKGLGNETNKPSLNTMEAQV